MSILVCPADILLILLENLDPLDIVHIGQTCKVFYNFCNQRIVWTQTARRLRQENAVFPPYSNENNYSIAELRREATAPGRFFSLLQSSHHSDYTLIPQRTRFAVAPVDGELFTTIRLVPGGHVLVTASDKALRIWDLRDDTISLLHSLNYNIYEILAMFRTKDNNIRISVLALADDDRFELCIVDFNMKSCLSQIYRSSLSSWSWLVYSLAYTISGDFFVFVCNSILHVWNFVADEYDQWKMPDVDYESIDAETEPQVVLMITKAKIYGWKPVRPDKACTELPTWTPTFTLDVPPIQYRSGQETKNRSLATWYGSTDFSLIYDVICGKEDGSAEVFTSFQIHLPSGNDTPGHVELIATEQFPKKAIPDLDMQVYSYRKAHNRLFKMWFNDADGIPSSVQVAFCDNPRTSKDQFDTDGSWVEANLKLPDQKTWDGDCADVDGILDVNLDPASGRLCFLLECSGCVGVVDYLSN